MFPILLILPHRLYLDYQVVSVGGWRVGVVSGPGGMVGGGRFLEINPSPSCSQKLGLLPLIPSPPCCPTTPHMDMVQPTPFPTSHFQRPWLHSWSTYPPATLPVQTVSVYEWRWGWGWSLWSKWGGNLQFLYRKVRVWKTNLIPSTPKLWRSCFCQNLPSPSHPSLDMAQSPSSMDMAQPAPFLQKVDINFWMHS